MINEAVEFMKRRNRINVKTAQMYIQSRELFTKYQKSSEKRNLSTFYIEIKEDFLPEPLILTILLDCRTK